jgi:hypothetical protein
MGKVHKKRGDIWRELLSHFVASGVVMFKDFGRAIWAGGWGLVMQFLDEVS